MGLSGFEWCGFRGFGFRFYGFGFSIESFGLVLGLRRGYVKTIQGYHNREQSEFRVCGFRVSGSGCRT